MIPRYKMESLNLINMRRKIKEPNDNAQYRMRNKNKKITKSHDSKVESADNQKELMNQNKIQYKISLKSKK